MTNPESSSDAQPDDGAHSSKVRQAVETTTADDPPDRESGRTPSDFASLAKSIRSRTTDIIAIAIVAAAGLSLAGWVSEWWRNDPTLMTASPGVLPPAPWESPDGVALQFGDQPWTMHRRQLVGDEQAITAALKSSCVGILEELDQSDALAEPDAAELNLLSALASFAPTDQRPGEWAIYELGGFLPWVIGVADRDEWTRDDIPHADHHRRVICWAMALPQPDGSWVLHTIHRHGGPSGATDSDLNLPLPSGTQPSLRLVDARGGSLVCFSGVGDAAGWCGELDLAWSQSGWRIVREWTTSGSARSAVFSRVTDEGAAQTAEVVLSDTGQAEIVGTLIMTTDSVRLDEMSEAP